MRLIEFSWILRYKRITRSQPRADFAIPADHQLKINEREKMDKYLDLARGIKKSC